MKLANTTWRTLTALALRRLVPIASLSRPVPTFMHVAPRRPYSSCSVAYESTDSSFSPPAPPASKGQPVFPDIDFKDVKSPEARKRNSDPDAVFVVTGASRGIGLQFVKSILDRTKGTVVACCRSPDHAEKLNEFVANLTPEASSRVRVQQLDVEDQSSIDAASDAIKKSLNRVDVLLNVAGLLGDGVSSPGPERSLAKIDRGWVEKSLAVNVVGPVMLSQALAPMMRSKIVHRSKSTNHSPERATSVIANLSARVGSISDNEMGGWYSYRFSKSALNQATRTMAHELKRQGTWVVALHPGTTDTDLSKPFQKNVQESRLFPVDFTVSQLLDVVDSLDDAHSGGLYDWAGKALPF